MLALQLARRGVTPLLIDRAADRGRGTAYATRDPAHLLNVPAGKMSAWPDAPDDFAAAAGMAPDAFAERGDFGAYLSGQLDAAIAAGAVEFVDGQAIEARPSTNSGRTVWGIVTDRGTRIEAEALVLATGNGRPAPFAIPGWPEEAMIQDPWSAAAAERLAAARGGDPLLLIGTGLTMVDVVLTLDRLGYRGAMTAVSRRGLIPRAHSPDVAPLPAPEPGEIPEELSDATAWLRARGEDGGWRSAVDSLRPVSQALWAGWDEETKARFVRHARPWWDVHRHRIAPEAAAVVERWQADGRLTVMAGRIQSGADGAVTIARRGGGMAEIAARLAVNCTGPNEQLAASGNVLIRQLLGDGLVAPGALGIGIAVDDEYRAGDGLWAMGHLTKGAKWEITAVPDIRVQAERMAEMLAMEFRR